MLSNSRAGPSPPPQLLRSALNSSAIPHTKMEWGHYTSGSLNAPCRHTQTCLVPPAQTRMHVSCSHAHRHCIQLRICFSQKPDLAVATPSFHGGFFFFFLQRVRVDCKLQLVAERRLVIDLIALCVYPHTPAPPPMGEAAAQPRAHSHFVTPRGTFPPLSLYEE